PSPPPRRPRAPPTPPGQARRARRTSGSGAGGAERRPRRHSRRALPVEGREVAVGAVRLAPPLDAEGVDHVAQGDRQGQAVVGGVERVVDDDALAGYGHAVDADDALVEQAVDPDADRLALLDELDGVTRDAAEVAQHG